MKNNDDEVEARVGIKKPNELLQQLLKEDEDRKPAENQDTILTSLGLLLHSPTQGTPGPTGGPASLTANRKRPSDESDSDFHGPIKRPGSGPGMSGPGSMEHVSSSGPPVPGPGPGPGPGQGRLWEKNKMLANLLAKPPSQPAVIPPVPASVISATPQDKLSRVADRHKPQQGPAWSGGSIQPPSSSTANTSQPRLPGQAARQAQAAQLRHNMMGHQDQQLHQQQLQKAQMQAQHQLQQQQLQQQQQQQQQWTGVGGPGPGSGPGGGGSQAPDLNLWGESDPYLSLILDSVIDIVPDGGVCLFLLLIFFFFIPGIY